MNQRELWLGRNVLGEAERSVGWRNVLALSVTVMVSTSRGSSHFSLKSHISETCTVTDSAIITHPSCCDELTSPPCVVRGLLQHTVPSGPTGAKED